MPHFPYLFIHGHLGCFHTLAIVTNDTVNAGIQIPLLDPVFNSFKYILQSGIAGSYGNPLQYSCLENPHKQRSLAGWSQWGCKAQHINHSTCNSTFLKQLHIIFHNGCVILHPIRVPISPHLHLFLSFLFDSSHLNGCKLVSNCSFDLHFPND